MHARGQELTAPQRVAWLTAFSQQLVEKSLALLQVETADAAPRPRKRRRCAAPSACSELDLCKLTGPGLLERRDRLSLGTLEFGAHNLQLLVTSATSSPCTFIDSPHTASTYPNEHTPEREDLAMGEQQPQGSSGAVDTLLALSTGLTETKWLPPNRSASDDAAAAGALVELAPWLQLHSLSVAAALATEQAS